MEWKENLPAANPFDASVGFEKEYIVHSSTCDCDDSDADKAAIEAGQYSLKYISENLTDESKYLLFSWDDINSSLSIVITHDDLVEYSTHVVKVNFERMQASLDNFCGSEDECVQKVLANAEIIRAGAELFADATKHEDLCGLRIAFLCASDPLDEVEIFDV